MAKAKSTCSIDGCEKSVFARKWCCAHYKRWRKYGDPLAGGVYRDGPKGCVVEGCEQKHEAKGYCRTHYNRLYYTGSATRACATCGKDFTRTSGDFIYCSVECKPFCRIEGCEHKVQAGQDVCTNHHKVIHRNGGKDPIYTWAKSKVCVVCGAKDWPDNRSRKYCSAACQQLDYRFKGAAKNRPKSTVCILCGEEFSITGRTKSGRLQRTDTLWCQQCGRESADARRYKKYGIVPSEYQAALLRGCDICGAHPEALHVDHDHNCCPPTKYRTCGKCVRGFLCGGCNRALGMFDDRIDSLEAAIKYLS